MSTSLTPPYSIFNKGWRKPFILARRPCRTLLDLPCALHDRFTTNVPHDFRGAEGDPEPGEFACVEHHSDFEKPRHLDCEYKMENGRFSCTYDERRRPSCGSDRALKLGICCTRLFSLGQLVFVRSQGMFNVYDMFVCRPLCAFSPRKPLYAIFPRKCNLALETTALPVNRCQKGRRENEADGFLL